MQGPRWVPCRVQQSKKKRNGTQCIWSVLGHLRSTEAECRPTGVLGAKIPENLPLLAKALGVLLVEMGHATLKKRLLGYDALKKPMQETLCESLLQEDADAHNDDSLQFGHL